MKRLDIRKMSPFMKDKDIHIWLTKEENTEKLHRERNMKKEYTRSIELEAGAQRCFKKKHSLRKGSSFPKKKIPCIYKVKCIYVG